MRLRSSAVALATSGLLAAAAVALAVAPPAGAAVQNRSINSAFSGAIDPNVNFNTTATCDECYPDAFGPGAGSWAFGAGVDTAVNDLEYASASSTAVSYDDSLLRQGQTLPVTDVLTPVPGLVTAKGTMLIQYGVYRDASGGTDFTPAGTLTAANKPFTTTFPCAMPLPGDPDATCTSLPVGVPVAEITVIPNIFPVPGLKIVLSVNVTVSVTLSGDGVAAVRSLQVVGGGPAQTAPLDFGGTSPSSVVDSVHFSCTQPVGNDVTYGFTNTAYAPGVALNTTTAIHMEAVATDIVDVDLFGGDLGSITNHAVNLNLPMTAPNQTVTLGALAKNNIPPTADTGGDYSGNQGTAVQFDGSGSSSVCGAPALRWDFSDGGVAFGAHPQHTFTGKGVYSGQLTATDASGLTSTSTFSVDIANLPPVVTAGPDMGAAWGVNVALNGAATDPGADDQSTLTYSWDFGDGTPSATGGAHALHKYATPGGYTATLTSCDHHNACSSDTTSVTIRKRNVTAAYLADTAGTYDTAGSLKASLTDELGNAVAGRTLSFTYDGSAMGDAATNSSGFAIRGFTPLLDAGTHSVGVGFAGDALYNSSSDTRSYVESRKGTGVTYTGAVKGGANKTVTLSAVLKDATGSPLASRLITFRLGSQTVSATTDATGVASTTLKLSQKNGSYPLTATYVPAGADAPRYVGSAASLSFALQVK
ncbi:MAG: large repetitive protein [Pseudonocardiales bacterium]|nr:large repetitive protein [Pseudonocardiales bacterium]